MELDRRDLLAAAGMSAVALPLLSPHYALAADGSIGADPKTMGEEKYIDADGYRTRYFEGGSGPAMVMVHGGQWPSTASAIHFAAIFDHLTPHYHVYAFDKLGMGYTDVP
jgi:hypothetical protein